MKKKNQNDLYVVAHVYGLCGRPCVIVLMKIIRIANECVSVYISIVYVNMYKCEFVCVCVCAQNFCPSVLILVFPTAFFPPSHSHVGRPVVRCIGQRGDVLVRSAVRTYRLISQLFVIFFSFIQTSVVIAACEITIHEDIHNTVFAYLQCKNTNFFLYIVICGLL